MENRSVEHGAHPHDSEEITRHLRDMPILSECSPMELARLLPHVTEKRLAANEYLLRAGEPATALFYVRQGQLRFRSDSCDLRTATGGFAGEEAAVGAAHYHCDALTVTPAEVLVIPRQPLLELCKRAPKAKEDLYLSLLARYSSGERFVSAAPEFTGPAAPSGSTWVQWLGWGLALLVPALVYWLSPEAGFDYRTCLFLTVFSSITVLWTFHLTEEFIPCILAVIAFLVLGIAPPERVLSGYASGEFFMAISIFGVGAVLVTSGLSYRIVLLLLRHIPAHAFYHNLAVYLLGLVFTPVIPVANGRVSLSTPLLLDMVQALRYEPRGKAATGLAAASFTGFTIFSAIFLTAKPINFVVYGLLPGHIRDQFQWGGWLICAAAAGAVLLVFALAATWLFFRSNEQPRVSRERIRCQLRILGPLSPVEWTALAAVVGFTVGTALTSLHRIAPEWLAMGLLLTLLAIRALERKAFHERVDWSFILYLAGLIGLARCMGEVGLDRWMAERVSGVGLLMRTDFPLFLLGLFVVMALARLVVPNSACIAIFVTVLIPMAQTSGVNPWVVGFVVLVFSDGWIFPYQCSYFLLFRDMSTESGLFDQRALLRFSIATNILRLAAVYVSLPYWHWLGML